MKRRMTPVLRRIMRKTVCTPTGCLEWRGYQNRNGYGRVRNGQGHMEMIHRVAYGLLVGPIPKGLTIDHLCRNRACWNPAHLQPVTQRENALRGNTVNARNLAKTHCIRGHLFDAANTYVSTRPSRQCRACHRERTRRRRSRQAAA